MHAARRLVPRALGLGLALSLAGGGVLAQAPAPAASAPSAPQSPSYRGRPIYSEPALGLQLPPACEVDPSWRARLPGGEIEVWVARCDAVARAWLVRRQVLEVIDAHQARLRFQVLDERILPDEEPGETLSVQCTGRHDESGYIVLGAHWRAEGRELRLRSARSVLRADVPTQRLVEAEIGQVDCQRIPEREAMMKRLQQGPR